jgi:hypothetical protein
MRRKPRRRLHRNPLFFFRPQSSELSFHHRIIFLLMQCNRCSASGAWQRTVVCMSAAHELTPLLLTFTSTESKSLAELLLCCCGLERIGNDCLEVVVHLIYIENISKSGGGGRRRRRQRRRRCHAAQEAADLLAAAKAATQAS